MVLYDGWRKKPSFWVGAEQPDPDTILFGIGLGGDYMIIPLMAAEIFGVKMMGRVMGVVLTADGVAEALAPTLVARLRDSTASYATGFSVLIGLALIGAAAISLLPRKVSEAFAVE